MHIQKNFTSALTEISKRAMPLFNSAPVRYVRQHPFSTMAICNIIGDLGFLGFAIEPDGSISAAKLAGAAFTIPAHLIILAYGDKDAKNFSKEHGPISAILLTMRKAAKILTTPFAKAGLLNKPYAVSFGMLALNGVGLFYDAAPKIVHHANSALTSQAIAGFGIGLGCGLFALADLVKDQKTTDRLTKTAPKILAGATLSNVVMAASTLNPYMVMAVAAFTLSNIAGFFTKIDKGHTAQRPDDTHVLPVEKQPRPKNNL